MIAILLGLLAALCWSGHDLVARVFAGRIGPFRMAFWILLIGIGLLLPIVLWRGLIWTAPQDGLLMALAMGVVDAIALGSLLYAFSIAPVSVVGPFTAGYPALAVLWRMASGYTPAVSELMALLFVLAGALVVGRMGPQDGGLAAVAPGKVKNVIVSSIMASVCFAAMVVMGQSATLTLGEYETTFISRIPAAACLWFLAQHEAKSLDPIRQRGWWALAAMAGFDSTAVTAINLAGLFPGNELGAMAISSYGAISVLLAMLILKERVALGQWAGIALVVAGVAILGLPK